MGAKMSPLSLQTGAAREMNNTKAQSCADFSTQPWAMLSNHCPAPITRKGQKNAVFSWILKGRIGAKTGLGCSIHQQKQELGEVWTEPG